MYLPTHLFDDYQVFYLFHVAEIPNPQNGFQSTMYAPSIVLISSINPGIRNPNCLIANIVSLIPDAADADRSVQNYVGPTTHVSLDAYLEQPFEV